MQQGGPENRQLVNFQEARTEGVISAGTLERVQSPEIQKVLALASGRPASEATEERVHLVTLLVDNSGSMRGNVGGVIKGHSFILDHLAKTPEAPKIWVATHLLCSDEGFNLRRAAGILDPYGPLLDSKGQVRAARLSNDNYSATGVNTPLYERSDEVLLSVLGKAQEFRGEWKEVTTSTLIMTDGGADRGTYPDEVAKRVADLRGTGNHLVAAMGFGFESFFTKVFLGMGIDRQSILTTNSESEQVEKALMKFAKLAQKAAATAITDYSRLLTNGWSAAEGK